MIPGQIIILNGAPRSGKSSIVAAIQDAFEGPWMNLGVDLVKERATPRRYQPGIGLRPGGERPDLEGLVVDMYAALYESIAAHSRLGLNVAVDIGHHDAYSKPRHILADCAQRLAGLPVLFVGVRCPIGEIMARRKAARRTGTDAYVVGSADDPIPAVVRLWQQAVHDPGTYDLEVDTSRSSPMQCAEAIRQHLANGPLPMAFEHLARGAVAED